MRWLLSLFSGLFFSTLLQGQTLKIDAKKFKEDAGYRNFLARTYAGKKAQADTVVIVPSKAYLVSPKPGVHRLPQDNMPCIVPDPRLTVSINNLWAEKVEVPFTQKPPRIPNPSKTLPFVPSRPLRITPDKDKNTK